ncbi:MAG: ABC transporter permease [Burkholderiales bacterium]|nr:ABC transporter permease [Anaerolineae bacterium]
MIEAFNRYQRQLRLGLITVVVVIVVYLLVTLPPNLLQSSIRLATPYVLGSLAALIASRAGVLNLAIDGKMLLGAFVGVAVLYQRNLDPIFGVIAATLAGGVLGAIFAVLYLRIKINLIILALAVNLFIGSATVFFLRVSFGQFGTLADPSIQGLPTIEIPVLENIPVLGPILSGFNIIVYLSWLLVFLVWLLLFRTRFGRHIRAVGENREAAQTAGINVTRVQIFALTMSGMLAGMAGSFLSLGILSQFLENMTDGRGWIAITVSLFAFERPVPAFFTSLFFGFSEAASFYLQGRPDNTMPSELLLALPQIATIAALVLVALRIRGGELLKRRNFVAQFGQEIADLKRVVVGAPANKAKE